MKRRTILQIGLFSLGMGLPSWLHTRSNPGRFPELDKAVKGHLLNLFHDLNSAKAIGTAYLNKRPELDEPTLLAHLCSSCNGGEQALDTMNDTSLRQWFNDRQKRDFVEGKTVRLEGWILSQTEVELCALAALS